MLFMQDKNQNKINHDWYNSFYNENIKLSFKEKFIIWFSKCWIINSIRHQLDNRSGKLLTEYFKTTRNERNDFDFERKINKYSYISNWINSLINKRLSIENKVSTNGLSQCKDEYQVYKEAPTELIAWNSAKIIHHSYPIDLNYSDLPDPFPSNPNDLQ